MPIIFSNSRVAWWPKRAEVLDAARRWAATRSHSRANVLAVGCFGSYARGGEGFGSDLDIVLLVDGSANTLDEPYLWDTGELPVPADVLTYNVDQWNELHRSGGEFARMLRDETLWLCGRPYGATKIPDEETTND